MLEFLKSNEAQLVINVTAVVMLIVLGYYIVSKFRPADNNEPPDTSDMITRIRLMREQGELSDDEYRTIKTKLAARFQEELNPNDGEGQVDRPI